MKVTPLDKSRRSKVPRSEENSPGSRDHELKTGGAGGGGGGTVCGQEEDQISSGAQWPGHPGETRHAPLGGRGFAPFLPDSFSVEENLCYGGGPILYNHPDIFRMDPACHL